MSNNNPTVEEIIRNLRYPYMSGGAESGQEKRESEVVAALDQYYLNVALELIGKDLKANGDMLSREVSFVTGANSVKNELRAAFQKKLGGRDE
jgi:hypothetical protein